MKIKVVLLLIFFLSPPAYAIISLDVQTPEYLTPLESVTVMRAKGRLCSSRGPSERIKSFSFIQLGEGPCPLQPRSRIGLDRPEEEPNSPGIPFKARGL